MEDRAQRIADGRTDLVFEHLAAGNDPRDPAPDGVPLIRWCAYYGDVSAIRRLAEAGESLERLGPNLDLNGAAFHGHWGLCQFLLERGADVDHPLAGTEERPLHAALCKPAGRRQELVVRVLLGGGARTDRVTRPGIETGCFMRDARTRGETALHRAAAFASAATIDALLGAGATVDARDAHGDSPLAWASWYGRPAAILDRLCFGEHRIHPEAVASSRGEHATDGGGLEDHLLGTPHV